MTILVICEPQNEHANKNKQPMGTGAITLFLNHAVEVGFKREDFKFVALCPPLAAQDKNSDKRKWAHVEPHVERIQSIVVNGEWDLVMTLGDLASRTVMGRSVQITKAHGIMQTAHIGEKHFKVFPFLMPSMCLAYPDYKPSFKTGFETLSRLAKGNFAADAQEAKVGTYSWAMDCWDLVKEKPAFICVDTEAYNANVDRDDEEESEDDDVDLSNIERFGSALNWQDRFTKCLSVQICWKDDEAIVIPVDEDLWKRVYPDVPVERMAGAIASVKALLEDPTVRKTGHNFKYDQHIIREKLGINAIPGWTHDTVLLAFFADDNMRQKSLDECVKRWYPRYAGYADAFNLEIDKSRMHEVPLDKFLRYAALDVIAGFGLAKALAREVMADKQNWNVYKRIGFPGLISFVEMEKNGLDIDRQRLRDFSKRVGEEADAMYKWLIERVPGKIKLDHIMQAQDKAQSKLKKKIAEPVDPAKVLSFSRQDFVLDILFRHPAGFKLKPQVFTKSTTELEDKTLKVPSISAKDHMPYFFTHSKWGEWIKHYTTYVKLKKLYTTYCGSEVDNTGFWKYITAYSKVHPQFLNWATTTGRTASRAPNGQNFPTKGELGKAYLSIFVAPKGWKLVAADLSQIELRLVAEVSKCPTMTAIYLANGDIHSKTAQATKKMVDAVWNALTKEQKKEARKSAKAVNFGFVYGMSWKKFLEFAFTQYDVKYTESEAEETRDLYFKTYRLEPWHNAMRKFVQENKFVRSLHGALRRLPQIDSDDKGKIAEAERQAINSPIQRLGSDLGQAALSRIVRQKQGDWLKPICFIHDALYFLVKEGRELEGVEAVLYAMETVPLYEWFGLKMRVPILAEPDIGISMGEKIELAEPPKDAEGNLAFPEWAKGLEPCVNFRRNAKPSWWKDELDMMCEEALW